SPLRGRGDEGLVVRPGRLGRFRGVAGGREVHATRVERRQHAIDLGLLIGQGGGVDAALRRRGNVDLRQRAVELGLLERLAGFDGKGGNGECREGGGDNEAFHVVAPLSSLGKWCRPNSRDRAPAAMCAYAPDSASVRSAYTVMGVERPRTTSSFASRPERSRPAASAPRPELTSGPRYGLGSAGRRPAAVPASPAAEGARRSPCAT